MSEYWVSKKKYFCKYCEIYIADDVPSRQHHENGLRHKGNVERFIRGIYKAGEKKKKDQEEEKREMARVEQAARAAFAQDVSSGNAKASSAPVASTSTQRKPAPKPSNPFANYSTAAQLGFTDPDAEKLEIRKTHGVVGDWEVVESTPAPPPEPQEEDVKPDIDASTSKRPAEAPPEDDTRTYKLRRKAAAVGLGEIYDPGLITIKLKKKENPEPSTSATNPSTSTSEVPKWTAISLKPKDTSNASSSIPSSSASISKAEETNGTIPSDGQPPPTASRWTKVQWGQPLKEEETPTAPVQLFSQLDGITPGEQSIKTEVGVVKTESDVTSLPTETTAGLFKKRKGPGGAGRGRRRL
ncbi:hypothetical protein P691DRAFT_670391 [Macrolepiota fuliginosa MF-IS2]|uniref:Matrin-type domain-containing protein n=1 Tax=Macrolepiota fuliginosa MF-IS2 TaxID=1400762 RepID=A0A9P5XAQ6_9AGAR|nr:hypothetical protein P691DRAFT_670391 [Macrolepiota fuliginosa MF-IS2]